MEQIINSKVCCKCNIEKKINEFYKDKNKKDGLKSDCKGCSKRYYIQQKQYRQANKEKISERLKQYYQTNKEKILEQKKQYQQDNKEHILEYQKQYRQSNKEQILECQKQYRQANKEKVSEYWKQYHQKPEVRAKKNERLKERYRTDPKFHINITMSSGVRHSLKNRNSSKGGSSWLDYVDYTLEQLAEHLERQFDDKMSWDNYGSYWHIDHIIPLSRFNYSSPHDEEFKKCWSLSNLQPLEATENMRKKAKTMEEWLKIKNKSSLLTPATI